MAFVAKLGDLLGGSTLGSAGTGWSILLSLSNVVDFMGGSTLGALRLGCTTLGEKTGRGGSLVGGLSGACVGLCVALALGSGVAEGKNSEAAASEKILLRRVRSAIGDCCKHAGIVPFSADSRLPAAEMTALAGVTLGFEIYLCLWSTVADTLVARVFTIQIFHAR